MRHKQVGPALCRYSGERIRVCFAQVRTQQLLEKVSWTLARMRHPTNKFSGFVGIRQRKIRPHRMKRDTRRFNFLTVNGRRGNHRNVPALLQLKRKRHVWVDIAK